MYGINSPSTDILNERTDKSRVNIQATPALDLSVLFVQNIFFANGYSFAVLAIKQNLYFCTKLRKRKNNIAFVLVLEYNIIYNKQGVSRYGSYVCKRSRR